MGKLRKLIICGRKTIGEIKSSLAQAGYEYDENMSIDDNIGSAMIKEFARGYNKGYTDANVIKTWKEVIDKLLRTELSDISCDSAEEAIGIGKGLTYAIEIIRQNIAEVR